MSWPVGINHPRLGTRHSRVTREKMSLNCCKFYRTEKGQELVRKMKGSYNPSKKISFQKSMSERMQGDKNPTKRIEVRKRLSLSTKKSWRNKKFKDTVSKKILLSLNSCPNKFEVRALVYLEKLYPGRFSYCGDGSVLINGRSADAIDPKTRTVALLNGVYWHLKKLGLAINNQNKRKRERIEACPFIEAGYKVLFIWEDELNRKEKKEVTSCH